MQINARSIIRAVVFGILILITGDFFLGNLDTNFGFPFASALPLVLVLIIAVATRKKAGSNPQIPGNPVRSINNGQLLIGLLLLMLAFGVAVYLPGTLNWLGLQSAGFLTWLQFPIGLAGIALISSGVTANRTGLSHHLLFVAIFVLISALAAYAWFLATFSLTGPSF